MHGKDLNMSALFRNAIFSIRMGVEDYRRGDPERDISAVRNFYAGILLLAKEALIRAAPNADPAVVIGAKLKPVSDGSGGLSFATAGQATIDFRQIGERAKDLGVSIDTKALHDLSRLRNDMEHRYTSEPSTAIRAAISKGFPVAASLFRQLGEDPVQCLGASWQTMLETAEVFDQELREARATLAGVAWLSPSFAPTVLKCIECESDLVEQTDPENTRQEWVEIHCRACGASLPVADVIEHALETIYGGEAYSRVKDGDGEGPVYECPSCRKVTLIEDEDGCAACGEPLDYEDECARCGTSISIQDYLSGLDDGLCSYCQYVRDKAMSED